jgi:hypothetical protein
MRLLKSVKALSDFQLECIFSDGTKGIADIKPYLHKGAFKTISDPYIFATSLHNAGFYVEWKNYEVDLSADTLWHISAKA